MTSRELRAHAEDAVRATRRDISALTRLDIQGLVHELQVHQVELEMQNESLRCSECDLQESQRQYQALFDRAPVGYVTLDSRGAIVHANKVAARFLELPRNSLVGQRITAFVAAEDLPRLQQQILRARSGAITSSEVRLLSNGQGDRQMQIDISLASAGDVTSLVALTDISERKRHLDALERLNRELASRSSELETRNQQLETEMARRAASEEKRGELQRRLHASERFESLGLLAARVAHDFNNLLVSVLGYAEMLLVTPGLSDDTRASASLIKRAGTNASDLTRQLLEFAGRGQRSVSAVDLTALTRENLELLQGRLPRGIQLRVGAMPRLPPIAADRGQVNQVVMNLVTNAVEALDGKGVVEVQTRRALLDRDALTEFQHHDVVQPGQFAILQVEDNGPGIDASAISRIFDPFFSTKSSGHGLGLASVLGIVHSHCGALRVQSTQGLGTRFEVAFPLLQSAPASDHPRSKLASDWAGSGAVLLIEDDDRVREVLVRLLTHLGFEVSVASGGAEGLELFRHADPGFRFVVLDWSMPGLSGEQVLKAMRVLDSSQPVILLSGYGAETLSTSDPYVVRAQKPITLAQLKDAAYRVLNHERVTTH